MHRDQMAPNPEEIEGIEEARSSGYCAHMAEVMVAKPAGTILAMDGTFGVVGPIVWVDMEKPC
jgi:hypothetical protein